MIDENTVMLFHVREDGEQYAVLLIEKVVQFGLFIEDLRHHVVPFFRTVYEPITREFLIESRDFCS